MSPPPPVSPELSPVNPSTEEGEESVDGGSDLTDVEGAFVGQEADLPKRMSGDLRPSKEDVELHDKAHLPYRSWCPHCVGGKAGRRNHMRHVTRSRRDVPVVS